ncbi:MAG: polysaccharide biosynthesis/export family protein [Rhodobacteraceae bacterium]|nr:polysaccharide biosynthesis/export family protein [Paracoccaceae bacterium]
MRQSIALVIALKLLVGCTAGAVTFPVTDRGQDRLGDDITIIRLDAENISLHATPPAPPPPSVLRLSSEWDYHIGIGDVLSIIVFDHPELTLPAGPERSAAESGFRVQRDGSFFYPFIGQVPAAGRAPEEIRAELRDRLADYVPDPQVEVRVAAFNSQRVVVTGEVVAPNRQPLTTVPLTLIEAINAAGGMTEAADARRVALLRDGKLLTVDLAGFLERGIARNNPVLRAGDIVTVPERLPGEAFLLGEVARPAEIDLSGDPVTLTQALARQGGLEELRADARGIFVFRARGAEIAVYQLETTSPAGLLLGTRFYLQPRDVVYVTRSPLQRWNDTISQILPSVRAITAVDEAAAAF